MKTVKTTYSLSDKNGVMALLRDRHKIAELRYSGDTNASDILIDLHSAIESAVLTDRQTEAIATVFGIGATQKQAGIAMGISQQAVDQLVNSACQRIAAVYERWKYGEITVELPTEGVGVDA